MSAAAVSVLRVTAAPSGGLRAPTAAPRRAVASARADRTARVDRAEPLLRLLVGATFRRHREEQGRTLAAVAAEARVSIAYLSEIERGRKEPSSEVLVAVCHALGMRLADLLVEAATELRAADRRAAELHAADRRAAELRRADGPRALRSVA